jgi:hypothetical protein
MNGSTPFDLDRVEELQRSIDAVLARIEKHKQVLRDILSDGSPLVVIGSRPRRGREPAQRDHERR